MGSKEGARRVFILLILIALGLVTALILPFGAGLVFATVLAATLSPLHQLLTRKLRGRASLSATMLCAAVLLLLLLPLGGLGAFVVTETVAGVKFVSSALRSEGMSSLVAHLPQSLQTPASELSNLLPDPQDWDEELKRRATTHGGQVARWMTTALTATGVVLFQATMCLIALFFMLTDGSTLVNWLENNSPLMKGQLRELIIEFRRVSRAVLVSSVVTSGVQSLVALVGYLIAGLPQVLFFGFVTFLISFIPAIGAGGVCLVAALLMLVVGKTWAAILLVAWIVPVGLVDNFVKPLLVKRDMHMHGGVVFFSLVGGIAVFGAVGLLLGPLIVTLLVALLRIYRRDFVEKTHSEHVESNPQISLFGESDEADPGGAAQRR